MKKKTVLVLSALMLITTLTACGKNGSEQTAVSSSDNAAGLISDVSENNDDGEYVDPNAPEQIDFGDDETDTHSGEHPVKIYTADNVLIIQYQGEFAEKFNNCTGENPMLYLDFGDFMAEMSREDDCWLMTVNNEISGLGQHYNSYVTILESDFIHSGNKIIIVARGIGNDSSFLSECTRGKASYSENSEPLEDIYYNEGDFEIIQGIPDEYAQMINYKIETPYSASDFPLAQFADTKGDDYCYVEYGNSEQVTVLSFNEMGDCIKYVHISKDADGEVEVQDLPDQINDECSKYQKAYNAVGSEPGEEGIKTYFSKPELTPDQMR